jgi:YjbE family integral membrane protein
LDILTTPFFWVTLAQIIMINIVLSGDNAVVIALASRSLPPRNQKRAILLGSFGAIFLRVVLTYFAVLLLGLPYLKIVGAVLLAWIGIQMLAPDSGEEEVAASTQLWAAIRTIIIADFVMSLDNVLGVAAAAKGHVGLLVVGLAISIPIIIYGSTLVLRLMTRWPIIVTIGGGVLGWVAGEMAVTDPVIQPWVDGNAHWMHQLAPALVATFVVVVGRAHNLRTLALARIALFLMGGRRLEGDDFAPPPGHRWVHRRWRTLRDGRRDYAALHGAETFRMALPISSRIRSPRR